MNKRRYTPFDYFVIALCLVTYLVCGLSLVRSMT